MIHVLTLTWNKKSFLEKLRPGLITNLKNTKQDYIWHIRSNGCKDDSRELIESWSEVKPLIKDHNRDNFAQGMNSLFEQANPADSDYILLLNNDVEFLDETSLSSMLDLFSVPEIAIVGARLLYPGTKKGQHFGVAFSPRYNNMPYHFKHGQESNIDLEKNRYFQAVTAACCLVQALDFKKVNGFNENLFWAFEDIDFNLKVGQLSKKIAYCGKTNIQHGESQSLKINPVNKLFLDNNVKIFKNNWAGKYLIDYETYEKNPNHLLI